MLPWLSLLLLAACATGPAHPPQVVAHPDDKTCLQIVGEFDRQVKRAGVADAQYARIPGFPFFRLNRFYASFAGELGGKPFVADWLQSLRRLDMEARRIEYANLPIFAKATLPAEVDIHRLVAVCGRAAIDSLLADEGKKQALLVKSRVADDYSAWLRLFGLYPVSALLVSSRIEALQQRLQQTFDAPLAELPVQGRLRRYGIGAFPSGMAAMAPLIDRLGFAVPDHQRLQALFQRHAPVFEIDVASDDDRPGVPFHDPDGRAGIDVDRAEVYWLPSYTRFRGEVLLQLNYVIWFPARTPTRSLDIYAGAIDSLIWRVTLDSNGAPLVYDSVHSCGCYHQLYPVTGLELKPEARKLREPPFVPQTVERLRPDERVVVRIAHANHYVQRVYAEARPEIDERLTPVAYQKLRSLPWKQGQGKSLFLANGLIGGTERPERWLLWPMGIASAGAMRQWGHHAVAFVGRRHFDDPYLIEHFFTMMP